MGRFARHKAATQFLVYTMVGSIALLLSFLAIFLATKKFDFIDLAALAQNGRLMPAVIDKLAWHRFTPQHRLIVFAGAFLGFAVKVPLVPFHTWLPSAYAEAPTGAAILLTGAMSKMGLYGFLRILLPIFGRQMQALRIPLLWLAVATIVFSAYAALAQKDLKRIFAYSSINHLGYCLLAIFALLMERRTLTTQKYAALNGVFLQMLNHALTAATLFWFVAMLEQRSGGLRGLNDFGGLRKSLPSSPDSWASPCSRRSGCPASTGSSGSSSSSKALSRSRLGPPRSPSLVCWQLQSLFSEFFSASSPARSIQNGSVPRPYFRERLALAPGIGLMFVLGLYPQLILGVVNSTVMQMVQRLGF